MSQPETDNSDAIHREPPSCAELLKALADETRLAIVRVLMDGPRRVFEINATLDIEQSLLSHHLRALRETGIVYSNRDGKAMRYALSPHVTSLDESGINLGCCRLTFR